MPSLSRFISYLTQLFLGFRFTSVQMTVAGDTGLLQRYQISDGHKSSPTGSVKGQRESCKVLSKFGHSTGMISSVTTSIAYKKYVVLSQLFTL